VVLQGGGKIDVPVTLRDAIMSLGLDEGITVQNVVGNSLHSVSIVR